MIEYENYMEQMRMPAVNQDLAREIAKQRKARRKAFFAKLLQKPAFERMKNRIMIWRLNKKLAEAKQYSIDSLSQIYVFRQGMDFVTLRKKDIKANNIRKGGKSFSMRWVADNAIAVYFHGKCVEHKNFTFNNKLKF